VDGGERCSEVDGEEVEGSKVGKRREEEGNGEYTLTEQQVELRPAAHSSVTSRPKVQILNYTFK